MAIDSRVPTGSAIEAEPGAPVERGLRQRVKNLNPNVIRAVSVFLTLLIWEVVGRRIDPLFFSYPSAMVATIPEMWRTGDLQEAFLQSMQALGIGWTAAIVTGVGLGLVMGRYRFIDNLFEVQLAAMYATPRVALIPLLILWFGLGLKAKAVIVFLTAFFPIIINTRDGVRNVSRSYVEIAQVERATERQVFTKIIVPASMPFIMTGIRLSVGRALVGMVVAEMFTAITGLGGKIVLYGNQFATAKLLAVVSILALLGVVLTQATEILERRVSRWKTTERANA